MLPTKHKQKFALHFFFIFFCRYLFWSEHGPPAKIVRIGLDGNPATRVVLSETDIAYPLDLTLDYEQEQVTPSPFFFFSSSCTNTKRTLSFECRRFIGQTIVVRRSNVAVTMATNVE